MSLGRLPVGDELRALLSERGRGISEFARDAGISHAQFYRFLAGQVPSPRLENRIRRALGLSPQDDGLPQDVVPRQRLLADTEIPLVVREVLARNLEPERLVVLTIAAVQQMEARSLLARSQEFTAETPQAIELRSQARRLFRSAASWYGVADDTERQTECIKARAKLTRMQ